MWGLLIILALAVAVAVVVSRLGTAAAKARFLQRSGLVLMAPIPATGVLYLSAAAITRTGFRTGGRDGTQIATTQPS